MQDWTGCKQSTYRILGASNHTDNEREENDYYATDPKAIDALLEKASLDKNIWECACGAGHLANRLKELGYNVKATDLVDRGMGGGIDFLQSHDYWKGDILTNPPYRYAQEFVEHALELIPAGNKVYMFLRLTFLEGQKRRALFETKQLKTVYVFSKRIICAMNGNFEKYASSASAYAWFEFEKGYYGQSKIEWIN